MRFVPMPRRMPRRGSLFSVKKLSSAAASAATSRTSPPTTMPGSSGTRASCTSSRGPPLLTTREAAIWEAPILRPTISCFPRRLRFALARRRGAGRLRLLLRPPDEVRELDLLVQIHVSLHLRGEPQPALRRGRVAGGAAVAGRRWVKFVMPERSSRPCSWSGRDERAKRHLGGDDVAQHEVGERLLHRLHPARACSSA